MSDLSQTTGAAGFRTTQWTVVLDAACLDSDKAQGAFAQLYQDYWRPLYRFVRRRGYHPAEAEDVTQSFFHALIEKRRLATLEREGGKFRAFLLTSLKNHLANTWDRANAARRGGGRLPLSLTDLDAENQLLAQSPAADPELSFERDWAFTLLEKCLRRLEQECHDTGRQQFFESVKPHLQGDGNGRPYGELANELGSTEGALRVAVHRLRQRYGELLRAEIARTVTSEAEAQEELRYLIEVVGRAA